MRINPAVLVILLGGCLLLGAACGGVGIGLFFGLPTVNELNAAREAAERSRDEAERARRQAEEAQRAAQERLREHMDRAIDAAQRRARAEDKLLRAEAEEHWRQIQEGLGGIEDRAEVQRRLKELREKLEKKFADKVP